MEGYNQAAYKGRDMHASLPSTGPKRQLLRDLRRLQNYARLPSARFKEAADKGSEKASEAWHTALTLTLRARRVKLLRDLRRPPQRLPRTRPARPLTREPRRPQMRATSKEVAAEGAEKAADTLAYAKEEGGKQAKRIWRTSKEAAEKGAETAGHAWVTVKEESKEGAAEAEDA